MRLTTAIKDAVINAILAETFKVRSGEIDSAKSRLAVDVYDEFYGAYLSDMARLPEDFFVQSSNVALYLEGTNYHLRLPSTRKFGKLHEYSFRFDKDHRFTRRLLDIENRKAVLDRDRSTLKDTLNRSFRPITTVKRLLEAWPTAERYLPKEPVKTENLPAIKLETLDTLIEQMRGEKR